MINADARSVLGSSPLMRGTQERRITRTLAVGIIPANAGNTRGLASQLANKEDHPR